MRLIAFITALVFVPAIALAATPGSGSWSGSTSQGKSISFSVGSGKVKNLKVRWRVNCPSGAQLKATTTFGGKYSTSGGKFYASATNGWVRGTFTTSNRAKGTLRMKSTVFNGFSMETCRTAKLHWSAKR